MKKILLSILCVMTVYFAVSFLAYQPVQSGKDGSLAGQAKEPPRLMKDSVENNKDKTPVSEKIRLALEKLDEGMAKVEQSSTPEIREAVRQRHLEKYKNAYAGFFHSLKLGDRETNEALDIILERENKFLDTRESLYRTGFTKGGQDFAETRKIEQSLAEVQLRHLLGEEGYEKLTGFEKSHQADMMAKAQKIVSKQEND